MSKVEARVDSWNCQGRTRTGKALKGMVKARLEEKGQIKAREEKGPDPDGSKQGSV